MALLSTPLIMQKHRTQLNTDKRGSLCGAAAWKDTRLWERSLLENVVVIQQGGPFIGRSEAATTREAGIKPGPFRKVNAA